MRSKNLAAVMFATALAGCATRAAHVTTATAPTPALSQPAPPSETVCAPATGMSDSDGDLARVSTGALAGLCVETVRVSELGRSWVVHRYRSGRPGPLWILPHDNENSAFVSGIAALQRHGGTLVAVDNYGLRNNDQLDPNRVFGAGGSCTGGAYQPTAPRYTEEMLRDRIAGQPIIALHTNSRGYQGDDGAGRGNTSILAGGRYRISFPAARHFPGSASPGDTLSFVAGAESWPDGPTSNLIAQLNTRGVNVIYEYVNQAWTDCSLSNYALLERLGFYINIETVEGDAFTQTRIIDEVMDLLANPASPPAVS